MTRDLRPVTEYPHPVVAARKYSADKSNCRPLASGGWFEVRCHGDESQRAHNPLRRHNFEQAVRRKHALPQKGHSFETNCGGHRLRQLATPLVRESVSDKRFEILQLLSTAHGPSTAPQPPPAARTTRRRSPCRRPVTTDASAHIAGKRSDMMIRRSVGRNRFPTRTFRH